MLRSNQNAAAFIKHIEKLEPQLANALLLLISRGFRGDQRWPDVFQPASPADVEVINRLVDGKGIPSRMLQLGCLSHDGSSKPIVPIISFRSGASKIWSSVDNLRIFFSSGTTTGVDSRSLSAFSSQGLLFYKAAAMASFFGMLEKKWPHDCGKILGTTIYSLVPPVLDWPDSSLAQMIGWLGEVWPVAYHSSESLSHTAFGNDPVIIFGTAFHLVNLLEQNFGTKIPRGSIVVETGGTKGKSRSVTRSELYQLISRGFEIPEFDIVSEYGMCELASQAWDCVEHGSSSELSSRWFRFPWWAQISVMQAGMRLNTDGSGLLSVSDALRVDVGSRAILTEDLAVSSGGEKFKLLGRVPKAPLKGCSTLVEELASSPVIPDSPWSNFSPNLVPCNSDLIFHNAVRVKNFLTSVFEDLEARRRLTVEFGAESLADSALEDLRESFDRPVEDFVKAAISSVNNEDYSDSWLIIPSSSHSFSAIQILVAGFCLGLTMRVRCPNIAGNLSRHTFLDRFLDVARQHGFSLTKLGPEWRLGSEHLLKGERVVVFGDDDTCKFIRQYSHSNAVAFGNSISVSMVSNEDWFNIDLKKVIKDAMSLRQRGCLSSRALVCWGVPKKDVEFAIRSAFNGCSPMFADDLTVFERGSRLNEEIRLQSLGFITLSCDFNLDSNERLEFLFGFRESEPETLAADLELAVSQIECVLPVICVPTCEATELSISSILPKFPLGAIAASSTLKNRLVTLCESEKPVKNLTVRSHGHLNVPAFDGTHLGQRFFVIT